MRMIRVEVPARVYGEFVEAWPRAAWAWAEPVPGRTYKVHQSGPWETLKGLEAQELLEAVRRKLEAARREWRRK